MLKEVTCVKYDAGVAKETVHEVVIEEPLAIFVNGRHVVTAMISPQLKEEFVIGHLFTEGIIKTVEEIESLQIEKTIAKVLISHPFKIVAARKVIVSGCGGEVSFLDESNVPKIQSSTRFERAAVLNGVKTISRSPLHQATGGVHVVGLFKQNAETAICLAEDIGRHNALDKVIGYGLRTHVEFDKTFIASTGRISSEMALKCSLANIPLVTSRGATTSLAIEVAEKSGLCICGFVRGEKLNVYTHAERLA
jgi:FdhD protein